MGIDRDSYHACLDVRFLGQGWGWVFILSLVGLTQSACTTKGRFALNGLSSSNSITAVTPDTSGSFDLGRVVQNRLNPSSVLDIVGDSSNTLGSLCIPTGSSSGNATVCNCAFDYVTQGSSQHYETPVIYREINLVRCSYADIPADVTKFDVSIHLTNSDSYSNKTTYNNLGRTLTLDPTNPSSYVKPLRYQCYRLANVPLLFDGNVYDPVQSEDPMLTYPLNFYTSNLGFAISAFSQVLGSDPTLAEWSCPTILDPATNLAPSIVDAYNNNNHVNLDLFSFQPLNADSAYSARQMRTIFPVPSPATTPSTRIFDRSTFHLSRQASGIFNVPVNALLSPGIKTQLGTPFPPLGYGASPIVTSSGDTCPSVNDQAGHRQIPAGYQWVKVWLFRASLNQRQYATSTKNTYIACNPGTWDGTQPVLPPCTGASAIPTTLGNSMGNRFVSYAGTCQAPTAIDAITSVSFVNLPGESFDYIFVVSPPSITVADMISNDSDSRPYQPYRFYFSADCPAPNSPDTCTSGVRIPYGMKKHDINSLGDPSGSDPNRPGAFPVCAVQPIP